MHEYVKCKAQNTRKKLWILL